MGQQYVDGLSLLLTQSGALNFAVRSYTYYVDLDHLMSLSLSLEHGLLRDSIQWQLVRR